MPAPGPTTLLASREAEAELRDLRILAEAGLRMAPIVVVPAAAEEQFYRLNNLAARLTGLFAVVDLSDPDDDDIEELAPQAERLVAGHYLLDEFIDLFYAAAASLPERVRVRRAGATGVETGRGRPALLALKRNWNAAWKFEALWSRLAEGGTLLPEPAPVLLHAAPLEPTAPSLQARAAALLGRPVELRGDGEAGITAVFEAPPSTLPEQRSR